MFLSLLLGLNKNFIQLFYSAKLNMQKQIHQLQVFTFFHNKIYTTYSIEIQLYSTLNTIYSRYLVAPSPILFYDRQEQFSRS